MTKEFLLKIESVARIFLDRYVRSLVFLTLLLWLPGVFADSLIRMCKLIVVHLLGNFSFCLFIVLLITFVAYLLSKMNRVIESMWLGTFHLFFYLLFFLELFLFVFFDCHINANIFQLINETNSQESSEFLATYLLDLKFFVICLVLILMVLAECFFSSFLKLVKSKIFHKKSLKNVRIPICLLLFITSLICFIWGLQYFSFEYREDWKKTEGKFIRSTPSFYVYESVSQFIQERNLFEECARSNENIAIDSVDRDAKNIVVIIGESFNRYHSSLYGYRLKTNPKLSSLKNLFVFDDVISPINATSSSFQYFLSMSSIDGKKAWYEEPLFPVIFNRAGYNVVFFSNQFVKAAGMSTYDASMGFFNHPSLAPKLFDYRNSEKFLYDGDLLDDYKAKRKFIENDSLNLVFFHLYGQHMNPAFRFPSGRDFFKVTDYMNRTELNQQQKQEVANYDNATLYNDSIVYEIIKMYKNKNAAVVYFADHGDEANDYRPHIGRSRGLHIIGAPGLHCQLDIPFLIWLSDEWIAKNPNDVERFEKSLHRPFIIDDLPHLLMDIAKVRNKFYNPHKSLVNESFDESRKRVITPLASMPIDYDSVCTKSGNGYSIGFQK